MANPGFTFRPLKKTSGIHYSAPPRPIATVTSPDELDGAYLYLNDNGGDREIELPTYAQFSIAPNPDPTVREVLCIAGASGGGKSWIARGYAKAYKELFPKRKVFVFSYLDKDATLDTLDFLKRLDIKSFVEDPLEEGEELKGFKNSLVRPCCDATRHGAARRLTSFLPGHF